MNSLLQITPEPKSGAAMCAKTFKIQLLTWPTAAILNFGLSQIPPTLSRGSPPLNFSFSLHRRQIHWKIFLCSPRSRKCSRWPNYQGHCECFIGMAWKLWKWFHRFDKNMVAMAMPYSYWRGYVCPKFCHVCHSKTKIRGGGSAPRHPHPWDGVQHFRIKPVHARFDHSLTTNSWKFDHCKINKFF